MSALFECPECGCRGEWTDGMSVEAGDDRDEFWCQVCGAETPLSLLEILEVAGE